MKQQRFHIGDDPDCVAVLSEWRRRCVQEELPGLEVTGDVAVAC